ncbi:MAG: CCA tRNA nucleotidyltransferase, partial [Rhodovibrionaceae bacterium]
SGEADSLRRLGALVETDLDRVAPLASRLRLSNAERRRLRAMAAPLPVLEPDLDETGRAQRLYRLAPPVGDAVAVAAADAVAAGHPPERLAPWLESARTWQPPVFPLDGQDLLEQGVESGPEIGRLLAAVEDWWVEEGFAPDAEACRAKLKELAEAS